MLVGYNPRIIYDLFNPLNPELNPICSLLALLGAHHFLHVSRIRVKDAACYVCEPLVLIFDRYSNKSTLLLEIADLLQLGVTFMLSIHTP
jgi:hypothetical protein